MTPQEINRAIAEKCGWRFDGVKLFDQRGNLRAKTTIIAETGSVHPIWICAPNYFGDLNAMHEAEAWMEQSAIHSCFPYLTELKFGINHRKGNLVGEFRLLNATAPQRAEAFLRTFGLWKEDGR